MRREPIVLGLGWLWGRQLLHQLILVVGSESMGQMLEDVGREDVPSSIDDVANKCLRLLHIVQHLDMYVISSQINQWA